MKSQYYLRMTGHDAFILSGVTTKALIRLGVTDKHPTSKTGLRATQEAFNQWVDESGRGLSHIVRTLVALI